MLTFTLSLAAFVAFSDASLCCREAGAALGLQCECRQSCAGSGCNSGGNFGINAQCGTAVCCCGIQCNKPSLSELDECPTKAPTTDPTQDPTVTPTKAPTTDPTQVPTVTPTKAPTKEPSSEPSKSPSKSPTMDPTVHPSAAPTVTQCADWSPPLEQSAAASNGTFIPVPDLSNFPQLCQMGRSGRWNALDQWFTFECSCFDAQTIAKLAQFIQGFFYEFELNYDNEDGRFESYFHNYARDDVYLGTSLSAQSGVTQGPQWNDLEDLTSCAQNEPGYAELARRVAQTMDYSIAPGGVFIRDCVNGTVAYGYTKIANYRVRDGSTENQVAVGEFTLQRKTGSNVWLIKDILFTGLTVGYLPQSSP